MFKFVTHRPLWVNILTAIVMAFIIFFFFIFSLRWCTHHNESKTVPSVLGRSYDQAEELLQREGFEVKILDSVYTDTTRPLTVLKQEPEADEIVKINRTVYLTINRAVPPTVEMPNIEGYSIRSAEMSLKSANLRVGEITYKPYFAKDVVIEQLFKGNVIKPGTKLQMGSSISLVLGDGVGQEKFIVPNLIGKTFCEARSILEANGVAIGAIVTQMGENISDTCSAFIFKQSPTQFDEGRKYRYIRSGQLMDVWVQLEKPVIDTMISVEPKEPE